MRERFKPNRRAFLAAGAAAIAVAASRSPAALAARTRHFPVFDEIPDFQHTASYVRNDLCEPQWKRGDLLMVDLRRRGAPGSYVKAKEYGVDPQIMPFEMASAQGLKIYGEVVGVYRLPKATMSC
jgi:hypothetical protein